MRGLRLAESGRPLAVLCLGAHSDDIEIGAGGTILSWIAAGIRCSITWCVLGAVGERDAEARVAAQDFLAGAESADIVTQHFRNSFFPEQGALIKDWFEQLKNRVDPDVILTHRRTDAHQDHREIARHTWATFRNHLILEYEIPKWDGDLGQPNAYVMLSAGLMNRKLELLTKHFPSQHGRQWYDEETFRGLARLRGVECAAPERYAEAFVSSKILIS